MKRRPTTSDVMKMQILMAQIEIAKIRLERAKRPIKLIGALWRFWRACRAFDVLAAQLDVTVADIPRMRVL